MIVLECGKMNNPPVSEDIDIADDGTWNVNINLMKINQWYSFEIDYEKMYIIFDGELLRQLPELPKSVLLEGEGNRE